MSPMGSEAPVAAPRARKTRGDQLRMLLLSEVLRHQAQYRNYTTLTVQSPLYLELCWLATALEPMVPQDASIVVREWHSALERDQKLMGLCVVIGLGGGVEAHLIAANAYAKHLAIEAWGDGELCYGHYAPTAKIEQIARVILSDLIRRAQIRAGTNPL